ncbi:MAG TPA: hypothetical protein VJI68_00790 [Candidatus Nanoarchaeia archaeon]|nr:hypothetical protein [Candidatus Nanoarchaeia archaeon]
MEGIEPEEIGRFVIGIRYLKYQNGSLEYRFDSANRGIQKEIVLMKLKAYINKLKKDYYANFEASFK